MVARRPSSSGSSKEYPESQRGCFCHYINMATARKLLHTSGVLLLILLIIFLWHSATASPHCNSYGYYCYNATHYADCRARAGLAAGGGGGAGGGGRGGVHMCPDGGLCADNLPSRCQSALTDCGRSDHVCLNATHFQLCVETSVGTMLRMGPVESCGPYMQCRDDVSVMCAEVVLPPTADTLLTREGDKRCNAFGYRCLNATHYVQCGDGERARAAEACPPGNMCSQTHPSICAEPVSSPCSSFGHVCINDTHFETCVLGSNGSLYTAGQVDRCLGGTLCSNDSSTICYYPHLRNNQENDWKDREENSGIDTVERSSDARNTFDDTRLNNTSNNTHPSVLLNKYFELKNSSESFDDPSENHEVTTELLIELSSTPSANLTSKLSDNVKTTVLNQIENSSTYIYDQDEEQLEKQLDEIVTHLEPTSTISPERKESSQSLFDQNKSDIDFKEKKLFVNNRSNEQQGDSTSSSEINYNKESKNEANAHSIVREITIGNITVYSGNNYKESTTLSYDSSLGKAPDDRETNHSTSTESLPSHILLNNATDEVTELTNPTSPAYNNSLHLISVKTWSQTEDSHAASNESNFTHTLPNESLAERSENETRESTREPGKLQAGNTNIHVTEQTTDKYKNDSFITSNEVSEFFPKDSEFTVQCDENGKFSHPSGNASLFYCCINSGRQYTILTYECPPKSVFNPFSQQCVTSEVEIQISIQKDTDDINDRREINDTCTQPGKFPSSSANCSHFYVCIPFRNAFIKRDLICPFESEFNAIYMRCTVPQKANCSIKHNGTYWDIRDDDDTDAYIDLMNSSSEVKSLDSQDAFSEQEYYTVTNTETPPIQQFDDIFPEENGFGMFDTEEKDELTTKDSVNVMDTTVSENFIYRTTVYNNIKDIFTEKISEGTTDDRTNIVSELKSDSIQQDKPRENYESSTTTEDSTNYDTSMTPEQKYFTVTNRAYNERLTVSISEDGANIDGTEENYDAVNDDMKGESYETVSNGYLDSTTEYSTTAEGTTNDDTTMSPEQEYFTIKNDEYNERVTVPISEVGANIDDTEEHNDALSENIKGQPYEIGSQGYLDSTTEYSTNTEYTTNYEPTMTPQQEYFTVTNDVYNERVTTSISEVATNFDGIVAGAEESYDTFNDDINSEPYGSVMHGHLDSVTKSRTADEYTTTMTPEQEYYSGTNDIYNERLTMPISEADANFDGIITGTEENYDTFNDNINREPYETVTYGYLGSTTNALIWDYREITTEVAGASFADESTNDPAGDDTAIPIDSFKIDEDTKSYLEFPSSPIPETTTHVSFETGSTPLPKGDVESRDKSHFTDSSTGENTTENPFVTVTQTPTLSIVPVVTEHSIFNNTNIDTSLSTADSIRAVNLYDLTEDVNYDYQDAALREYSTENTIIDSTTILSNDRLISEDSEINNIHTEAVFTNTFTEHITRRIGNNPNAPPDTVTVMNSPKEYITSKSAVSEVEDNTDDATTPMQAATFSSPAQISSGHTERLVNDPMEYSMINIPDNPVTYITNTTRLPVTYITTDSTETIIPAHNTVASTKDNEEPMVVGTTNGVTIASTERVDQNQHATNSLTEVVSDFIQTDTSTAPNEVQNSDKNDHHTRSEITVLGTQVPDFIPKYVSIDSTGITTEDVSEYFTSPNLAIGEGTTENHYHDGVREGSELVITAPQVITNRDTTDSNLKNDEYLNPNSIPNSLENTHTTGSAETVTVTRSTIPSSPHFTQNISDNITHNAMEISERDDQVVTPMIDYDVTTVAVPQTIDDIAIYDVTYADSTTENVIITEGSDNSISITPTISTSATEVIQSQIAEDVTTADTVPDVDRMNQQPNKNSSMEDSTSGIDVMNFTRSNQSTDITTIIVGANSPSLNYGTTTRENTSTYHSQLSNSSVPTSTNSNASEQHSGFQDSVDMLYTNNPSSSATTTSSLDPHVHNSTFSEIPSATPTSTSATINEQLKETDAKHLTTSDVSQTSQNTAETSLSTSGMKRTSTTTYLPVIKTSTTTPASSLLSSTDNTKYSTPSSTSIISSTSRMPPPSSETLRSTTQSIFVCNSIGKFPNPYDVKSYYVCSRRYGGGFHTMKFLCPSTSRYFIEIQKCADVLWSTGSAASQRRARFVRRSVDDVEGDPGTREDQLDCRSSRAIANPLKCDTYSICVERESGKFSRLTLKCPTGFSFDPEAEKCVWDYPCGVISKLYD